MNITEIIKSNLHQMTKSEYRVATYFCENPNDFAFENLDAISKKIDTSTTSVIRFCQKIGFSGYKPFQEVVRSGFKYELTLPDKFNRTIKTETRSTQFSGIIYNSVNCIEQTFNNLSEASVFDAVSEIIKARRVFCFGLRESFALAHYAYTRFLTVRSDVFILSAGQNGEIESVLSLGKGDVCVLFLFHRYTKQSLQILRLLKKQGVTVILITSPPYDEIVDDASVLLPCFVDASGIKNSAVAPICIIDHLCNTLVVESGDEVLSYMKKSEALFKEFTF